MWVGVWLDSYMWCSSGIIFSDMSEQFKGCWNVGLISWCWTAAVPVTEVQEWTCMVKIHFMANVQENLHSWAVRLGSRGLVIFELKREKGDKLFKRFEEVESLCFNAENLERFLITYLNRERKSHVRVFKSIINAKLYWGLELKNKRNSLKKTQQQQKPQTEQTTTKKSKSSLWWLVLCGGVVWNVELQTGRMLRML